jgi:hypothetical protein
MKVKLIFHRGEWKSVESLKCKTERISMTIDKNCFPLLFTYNLENCKQLKENERLKSDNAERCVDCGE